MFSHLGRYNRSSTGASLFHQTGTIGGNNWVPPNDCKESFQVFKETRRVTKMFVDGQSRDLSSQKQPARARSVRIVRQL